MCSVWGVHKILFVSGLLVVDARSDSSNPLCTINTCPPGKHTMCLYENKTKVRCAGDRVVSDLSPQLKDFILDLHNALRSRVAQGKERAQPPASDMLKLEWDDELAVFAKRWVIQCHLRRDVCRNSERGVVGQAFANCSLDLTKTKGLSEKANRTRALKNCFKQWYEQVVNVRAGVIDDLTDGAQAAAQDYLQIVTARTQYLGCGYLEMTPETVQQPVNLVCNYLLASELGRPVYHRGSACSLCQKGYHCSHRYKGLCTADKMDVDDDAASLAPPHGGWLLLAWLLGRVMQRMS